MKRVLALGLGAILVLLLLALLCAGVVLLLDWPPWLAPALLLGCVAVWLLARLLRRLWVARRARSRVVGPIGTPSARAAREQRILQGWRTAVATLRGSALRRHGDALRALPWFLVLGASGTGKTTALARSGQVSNMQVFSPSRPIEPTPDFDWWYFERAVLIDCAGRYVDAPGDAEATREWNLTLDQLARHRRGGVDGVVLAISAARLLAPPPEGFIDEGRAARMRIESLMRAFGTRMPVYLLVTQCDRIYGFESWVAALPPGAARQALGHLGGGAHDAAAMVDTAFDAIHARLRLLRVQRAADGSGHDAAALLLPDELARLRQGVQAYVRACLADEPYLERPFMRGLFLGSALQPGGARSALLGDAVAPEAEHPPQRRGLFLSELFDRVLPAERGIGQPAALPLPWRRRTGAVALGAWFALGGAGCIALGASATSNLRELRLLDAARPGSAAFGSSAPKAAAELTRVDDLLRRAAKVAPRWLSSLIGYGSGIEALAAERRAEFVRAYRVSLEPTEIAPAAAPPAVALPMLLDSIERLRARLRGEDPAAAAPQRTLALAHLAWSPVDDPHLVQRLRHERERLDSYGVDDLAWLVDAPPARAPVAPLRLEDFWPESAATRTGTATARLAPGYTVAGRHAIEQFLDRMAIARTDPAGFTPLRTAFDTHYRAQRLQAWHDFIVAFVAQSPPFLAEEPWRAALPSMATPTSPYLNVLAQLAALGDDVTSATSPPWLELAQRLDRLVRLAAAPKGTAGALEAVGDPALRQALRAHVGAKSQARETDVAAIDLLRAQFEAMAKLGKQAAGGSAASYRLAADFHGGAGGPAPAASVAAAPTGAESSLREAAQRLDELRRRIAVDDPDASAVWNLLGAPLDFLMRYVERQASCQLQERWQADVLWPLQAAPDTASMVEQVFGAKGTLWAFADGPARPFLRRDARQYQAAQALDWRLPFAAEFLPGLNGAVARQRGAAQARTLRDAQARENQDDAQRKLEAFEREQADLQRRAEAATATPVAVTITAQPSEVDADAHAGLYAGVLTVRCAGAPLVLRSFNFEVAAGVAWSPAQCSDTTLQLRLGELELTRSYPGALGLADFAREFGDGERVFTPADFPAQRAALQALGVQHMTLRYRVDGGAAVQQAAATIRAAQKEKAAGEARRAALQQRLDQARQQAGGAAAATATTTPATGPALPDPSRLGLPARAGQCWHAS